MARFPVEHSELPEIGKALARAVVDPVARAEFQRNTSNYLIEAGVDPGAIEGLTFTVAVDTATNLNMVIPASVDQDKIDANDTDYLVELGNSVVLGCAL